MANYFPSCNISDDDPSKCLNCGYSQCVLDLVDKQIELKRKRELAKDKAKQEQEEKENFEKLLQVRWENYHKYHPNSGMAEEVYKATQRQRLMYQKEYRARKKRGSG